MSQFTTSQRKNKFRKTFNLEPNLDFSIRSLTEYYSPTIYTPRRKYHGFLDDGLATESNCISFPNYFRYLFMFNVLVYSAFKKKTKNQSERKTKTKEYYRDKGRKKQREHRI